MDKSQLFNDMVACDSYPTYSEFKNALVSFQKTSGYVFVKRTIRRYNEGDPLRKTTIYRGLYYSCTCWGENRKPKRRGTNCGSFIKVRGIDGFLRIIAWNMVHNHPPQLKKSCTISNPESVAPVEIRSVEQGGDLTHLFLSIFPQIWFLKFAQFEESLQEFERISGIHYDKLESDNAGQSIYSCYHHRTGCKSKIILNNGNGLIRITHFDMTHEHLKVHHKMEISSPLKEQYKSNVISTYLNNLREIAPNIDDTRMEKILKYIELVCEENVEE